MPQCCPFFKICSKSKPRMKISNEERFERMLWHSSLRIGRRNPPPSEDRFSPDLRAGESILRGIVDLRMGKPPMPEDFTLLAASAL